MRSAPFASARDGPGTPAVGEREIKELHGRLAAREHRVGSGYADMKNPPFRLGDLRGDPLEFDSAGMAEEFYPNEPFSRR